MKRSTVISLCITFGAAIGFTLSFFSGARWFEWRWIGWVSALYVLSGLFFGAAAALSIEDWLSEHKKWWKK